MLRSKKTFWSSNFFYLSSYYGLVAEPRWWLVLRLSQSNQFRLDLTGTELAKSYTFFNEFKKLLSKPNATQLNSKATSVGVKHSSHVYPTHPTHPTTTTNFSATSRPARELKFGTDTH